MVRDRVVHEVFLRPGRDDQQRQARTVTATALGMQNARIASRQRGAAVAAGSSAGQSISRASRLIHNRAHLMVVPAVRVVIGDHYRGVVPIRRLLQSINDVYDKRLLIERIGISRVPILKSLRLQEADRRKVPLLHVL